jgi:hypothetical protein
MTSSANAKGQRICAEINSIFSRMEVPLSVIETPEEGKFVRAAADLPAGTVLFEEKPLVCWPFSKKSTGHDPWAFCSLCLRLLRETSEGCGEANCKERWCSPACKKATANQHLFLCGDVLIQLRNFHDKLEESSSQDLLISVEAVSRCVASIAVRFLSAAHHNPDATTQELFSAATQLLNRFIEPPVGSDFEDINLKEWNQFIRVTLTPRLVEILGTDRSDVVFGLTSDATLSTIIGQLTLNSQGLNLILRKDEEDGEPKEESDATTGDEKLNISVGAGLFTLQSCFNHSCDPNAEVVFSDNSEIAVRLRRAVKVDEPITITYISPLYLVYENFAQRRDRLSPYFFTCRCERCSREEAQQASAPTSEAPAATPSA